VTRPFLHDLSVMARFLVCLPLFLSAEIEIGRRQGDVITYLWNTDILTDGGREQYATYVRNLTRWHSPAAVELILVLLACVASWYQIIGVAEEGVTTWFGDGSATLAGLTAAGWWGALVCQPLWLFLFFRWGWRAAVWWRFLARLSRQDLRLVPIHPDRVGGLGVMALGQSFFVMLTFGVASILAADLAEAILAGEMTLRGATPIVVVYVLISALFIVGPLFSFTALLIRTKRRGMVEYGDLGDELFRGFDEKWPPTNPLDRWTAGPDRSGPYPIPRRPSRKPGDRCAARNQAAYGTRQVDLRADRPGASR